MGFTSGLYKCPKYEYPLSYRQIIYIEKYFGYENEEWAKKQFSNPNDYALYNLNIESFTIPSQEAIDFYKDHMHTNDMGRKELLLDLGTWCSNGGGDIHKWFETNCEKMIDMKDSAETVVMVSKQNICDFMEFCWTHIKKYGPQPAVITHAFKYEGDNIEEQDIRLIPCDGIEVQFDGGCIQRFDTKEIYGEEFLMPKLTYDDWDMSGYICGLEYAMNILKTVDFEKEIIFYCGGY